MLRLAIAAASVLSFAAFAEAGPSSNKLAVNGVGLNKLAVNGVGLNKLAVNGVKFNGVRFNTSAAGEPLGGVRVLAVELPGETLAGR